MGLFDAKTIAIAFISMFASIWIIMMIQKLKWQRVEDLLTALGLVASLYCIVAAIFLWGDWHDPLATSEFSAQELGKASASGRGRGGLLILAVRFWPYVLGGVGAYFAYNQALSLYYSYKAAKRRG